MTKHKENLTASEIIDEVEYLLRNYGQKADGGFIVIDICGGCGKISLCNIEHNNNYNHQCSCGYLTGFIGRNHAN